MPTEVCIIPGCCIPTIYARQLCRSCYIYAARLVRLDIMTWRQQERAELVGRVRGSVKSAPRVDRAGWFARAIGLTGEQLTARVTSLRRDERLRLKKDKKKKESGMTDRKPEETPERFVRDSGARRRALDEKTAIDEALAGENNDTDMIGEFRDE